MTAVSSQNEDESHCKGRSDIIEYFIYNMYTTETKTIKEQETEMLSTTTERDWKLFVKLITYN